MTGRRHGSSLDSSVELGVAEVDPDLAQKKFQLVSALRG
jgi:hypothetical protein